MLSISKSYFKTTRFKTTLWYSLLFLILELVIGFIIYFNLSESMSSHLDNSLSRQAESIYNYVKDAKVNLLNFQPDSVYTSPNDFVYDLIFDAVTLNMRNTYVEVQFNGKSVFKTDNLRNHDLVFPDYKSQNVAIYSFSDTSLSDDNIRAAYLNKDLYKIVVAYPVRQINETLSTLVNIFIVIAPVFLILSIVGGAVISSKSLSRIDSIIKKTEEITTQNLDEKIDGEEFSDEYGRLVKKMNEMIQRIKSSILFMNQFSISASHELKTPLTILRGEIELALRSPKTNEEYKKILQSNYEETLRLINIVDKLFFISKVDHSVIKLKKQSIQIDEFLTKTVSPLKYIAEEKNMKITLNADLKAAAEIDPELMKLAISNLIDNAIKYGEHDSEILIEARKNSLNKIVINVINKGEGIPLEQIPKIFDRFYRVESSRNRDTGGVGLGLSVVKSIIDMHHAKVEVDSVIGKTTKFSIILN
jgi:heavy metal sensor kinase